MVIECLVIPCGGEAEAVEGMAAAVGICNQTNQSGQIGTHK